MTVQDVGFIAILVGGLTFMWLMGWFRPRPSARGAPAQVAPLNGAGGEGETWRVLLQLDCDGGRLFVILRQSEPRG